MYNQTETPGSESESNLMDYGLFDPHTGLPQRNYSRGEAKVYFISYLSIIIFRITDRKKVQVSSQNITNQ